MRRSIRIELSRPGRLAPDASWQTIEGEIPDARAKPRIVCPVRRSHFRNEFMREYSHMQTSSSRGLTACLHPRTLDFGGRSDSGAREDEMDRRILDDLVALSKEQSEHARQTERRARELVERIAKGVS